MRPTPLLPLLLLSCAASPDGPKGTTPTGGSGSALLSVACAAQAGNVLRYDCAITSIPPAPLTVTLQEQGEESDGPVRVIEVTEALTDHVVTLSGLAPETTYAWGVDNQDMVTVGELTTAALPAGFPELTASGTASFPYVLFALGTRAFVADTTGRIVWYEDSNPLGNEPMNGLVSGYDWTGDGVILHITSIVRHIGIDGAERLRLERGVHFDRPLHNDIFWAGDHFWSLNADAHTTANGEFVFDGLYAFDDTGVIAEWDLRDHFTDPQPGSGIAGIWDGLFPGARDVAQGNSIFEAADGTLVLSFRQLSQVWALAGLDDPAFGTPQWKLGGQGDGDFALQDAPNITASPSFQWQHHARLTGDRLTMMDNRADYDARVVEFALDHPAGTATPVESHQLWRSCPLLGGAYRLSTGNLLTNCANSHEIMEYLGGDPEDVDPDWVLDVDTNQPWLARPVPIETPPMGW